MKKIYLFLSLVLFGILETNAQSLVLNPETQKYQVQEVIKLDTLFNKEQLFNKAKEWIALNYKAANQVIQLEDKEAGKLICKGNYSTSIFMKPGRIQHTMVLDFKDGRVRYTITDFAYYDAGLGEYSFEKKWAKGQHAKAISSTEQSIRTAIASLKSYISDSNSKDDNW